MTRYLKYARVVVPLALAAMLGLAACSNDPTPDGADNFVENESQTELPAQEEQKDLPAPANLNEAPAVNVADVAPVDHTSEDQQMQQDAEAAGMTSRMNASEETAGSSNEATPDE